MDDTSITELDKEKKKNKTGQTEESQKEEE